MTSSSFRVIVVGASVAGLTLAHCLDQAGIDYLVLEKQQTIDETPLGGFIAIQPNGARILAQLGLYDAVFAVGQAITVSHTGNQDGFHMSHSWPTQIFQRLGFPLCVLRRQELLHILYRGLKNQSKILSGTKVKKINQSSSGVLVQTDDGSVYQGDVAVGADGVHSTTRSEIWRMLATENPGRITYEEKSSLTVEFSAVVGISTGIPDLQPGEQVIRILDNRTIFVFGGKGASVGWIVIQKLDRKYFYPNRPHFTQDDAVEACKSFSDCEIWRNVKFRDVFARQDSFAMVPLEEAILREWHYRRVVCIADSINKMTPNIAQGANTAIEHAVVLTNTLHQLVESQRTQGEGIPETEINDALDELCRRHYSHLRLLNQSSWLITRMHARQGWMWSFFGRYVFPWIESHMVLLITSIAAQNPTIKFLPAPSPIGWVMQKEGWNKESMAMMGLMVLAAGVSYWLLLQ